MSFACAFKLKWLICVISTIDFPQLMVTFSPHPTRSVWKSFEKERWACDRNRASPQRLYLTHNFSPDHLPTCGKRSCEEYSDLALLSTYQSLIYMSFHKFLPLTRLYNSTDSFPTPASSTKGSAAQSQQWPHTVCSILQMRQLLQKLPWS